MNKLSSKLLKHEKTLVTSEERKIKHYISTAIIEKLSKIIDELSNNEKDLHKYVSTLRYTLETLIISKLLIKEPDYFLKMYYSLHKHQENKTKQMITRIDNELKMLKEYSQAYSLESEKNKQKYTDNPKKFMEENEKIFQHYKKSLQDNINIFFNQLEEFGFESLIYNLEEHTLKLYKDKLNEFENLTLDKEKHLSKAEWFKEYFDVKDQHSKVSKCLGDVRSWKEKADIVDLKNEYELNYEVTSSLLHLTSYSLFTPNEISDDEINYNNMIINQYISQITTNISAFSKVIIYEIFNVVIKV
ncbi:hypothetical protein [Sulfurimonas sp.]